MKRRFLPRIRKRVVLVTALCLMVTSSFFLPPLKIERLDRYNNFIGNAIDHWVEDHTPRVAHNAFTHLAEIVINPFSYLKEKFHTEQRYSTSGKWVNKALTFLEDCWKFLQLLRTQIYIALVGGTLLLMWTVARRDLRRNQNLRLKGIQPRTTYRFAEDKRENF
jgi:hypothetical protein